jgi:PTS system cellobiose-specific IIB component
MSKKILLVCMAGMSTSLLVNRMKDYVKDNGLDYDIKALPAGEAQDVAKDQDCILLGPQVGFQKESMQGYAGESVPVDVIPMRIYGSMDAPRVINMAKKLMGE